MTGSIHSILKQQWGYDSFRPMQEEIIQSVLDGKDTLALLPTGGGKSVCFQVPALAMDGLCLVISPLIALMKDQVENLRKKNITAFAIYSGMSRKEVINTLKIAGNSNCKFLYVSPERLETNLFKEYLPSLHINLIAVDEAHCISQWGYDFRPPYLRIAALREELPNIPVLALTASATKEVQDDICEKLNFGKTHQRFQKSFERPNLSYSVFYVPSRINKVVEVLQNVPGTGIVYCKSRKRTQEVAEALRSYSINADYYHAGLRNDVRNEKQQAWINNKTRVMVCTNAFGMGIDKPDVRSVIHYDVPDCLENYYQEAGRAGRDEQKAYAVLLYEDNDLKELEEQVVIRFPGIENIRIVYQSLANYLQVPVNGGEDLFFDFDLNDFLKKFKLNIHTVVYSLKALEQEAFVSFSEQIFLPARVQFVCNKDYIKEIDTTQPHLTETIKGLLRSYEGIFDIASVISEKQLARFINEKEEQVIKNLQQLHQLGVINYQPQKDKPQLQFLQPRIKAEDLTINQQQYQKRKEVYAARVKAIINYVKETSLCRSKMIAEYFNDNSSKNCSICDNCLHQKRISLSTEEINTISGKIFSLITNGETEIKDLLTQLKGIHKEKVWKVLNHLVAEEKLVLDKKGNIGINKKAPNFRGH
ncbi:MAG: RecQ family ATP-dependent DNA helicase [Sphingobacteriales bacterium]|nr:MAG: RecQ family ATP-dependent DNA helicase [Sphingobacteriales bacterium]